MALNSFFSIKVGIWPITYHGPINAFKFTSGTALMGA
jgi:hypothetical protein